MAERNKLYALLRLRRRIDRKISLNQKWPIQFSVRNKIEIFVNTLNFYSLVASDKNLYFLLNKNIEHFARKNNLNQACSSFEIESVNNCRIIPDWFKNLKEYGKRLDSLGAKLIIQGSYSDSEITAYSDVDLVILYKPFDQKILAIKKEIDIFLLSVDPLQHHGVFLIDINTFSFYWQMDLPIQVLRKAKHVGDSKLTLAITGVMLENKGSLNAAKNTLDLIKNFPGKDYNKIGMWEWKFFISEMLLLPTLILGSKGNYLYKKESFPVAKNMFSNDAWYCIEKATQIRNLWPAAETFKSYNSLRGTASEKPARDILKVIDISSVSVENDTKFLASLEDLIKESNVIVSHD